MAAIFSATSPDVTLLVMLYCPLRDIVSCDSVSKQAHQLVKQFDETKTEADDFTLERKSISRTIEKDLLHHLYKMQIFTTRPELLKSLYTVRDEVRAANGNADEIIHLYNHVAKQDPLRLEEMRAVVLYDYTTKQIPGRGRDGLAYTLNRAVDARSNALISEQTAANIAKGESSLKLIWAILFHPNPIPKERIDYPELIEQYSIQNTLKDFIQYHDSVETVAPFLAHPQIADQMGHPLYEAAYANRPKTALATLAHPSATNIPASGDFGLGCCLLTTQSAEISKSILSHKNAKDISAYGNYGFNWILNKAAEYNKCNDNKYLEKAKVIRDFPAAAEKIEADGISGLKSSLHNAAIYDDKEMAKVILSFPNAKHIPQEGQYNLQETCKKFDLPNPGTPPPNQT